MTSENMQFRSFTRDVGVLGWNTLLAWLRTELWFQVSTLSVIFCCSFITFGRWNSCCSEKPLKVMNRQPRESGCNSAHQSPAEALSCCCSVRKVDQGYPQTWHLGSSPLTWRAWFTSQRRLQAHLHSLNLVWFGPHIVPIYHILKSEIGSYWQRTLLWAFVLGWDAKHFPKGGR